MKMTSMDDKPILSFQLLGGFVIAASDNKIIGVEQPNLQRLIAFLLLNKDQPISRTHLAFTFWTDSTETQALANLRNLWFRLRQVLPDADQFITADRSTVRWLDQAPYWLDVAAFKYFIAEE